MTDVPAFNPQAFLSVVGAGRTLTKYRKNQRIFSQGDLRIWFFIFETGKVKVTVVSERGKEAVVAMLGKDEFCGEGCLSGQPKRLPPQPP